MEATHKNSLKSLQGQDSKLLPQSDKVYQALKIRPMTMKEVDVYTGVMRENCCWYFNHLLEQGKIAFIKKRRCSITGYPHVGEYSADPSLFPSSNQLKMF